MRCRACPQKWTFAEEFCPLLTRVRHTCPQCGWVSRRPEWLLLLWLSTTMTVIGDVDSWTLRIAMYMILVTIWQVVMTYARAKDAPAAEREPPHAYRTPASARE